MSNKIFDNVRKQTSREPTFRLIRHFQLISLPAIVVILIVAGLGLRLILRRFVLLEAEKDAIRVSVALRESEMRQFIRANQDNKQSLSVPQKELPELDRRMRIFLAPFDIVKIKIYDTSTRIIYSTDSNIIGKVDTDNRMLATALRGSAVSKHETKDTAADLQGEKLYDVEIVETYVPVRSQDGEIIGSFEIYKDVTDDLATADSTLIQAGAVLSITVLGVFGALMFVIHHAAQAINTSTTALRESKEKYRSLGEKLEAMVEQLTRANREIQDFTHVASHDLKSPLRAIATLADWLLKDDSDRLDERGKERVKLLSNRAKRAYKLVDSMLQYSEIGYSAPQKQQADLNRVLSEVIHEINPPANIEIIVENELPGLIGDKQHIKQVFQHLLNNAVQYMDKPEGQITLGCVKEDGYWKFSVTDNGPGIEEKYFEKIFKMFQTLLSRDEFESTGIGLTVVKKIVEMYGGKIWLQSKVGEGATFFFTLPEQEMGVINAQQQTYTAC